MDVIYSICSATFYGSSGILDTLLVKNNDIFDIFILKQFVYFFVSIIIFLFFFKNLHTTKKLQVSYTDLFILFIAATLGTVATFLFLYSLSKSRNKYLTFGILYALPIVVYSVLNYLIMGKQLTYVNLFGIMMVCIGLVLISLTDNEQKINKK
uniref:EamA domain-containing protein n=1 Tax=viral metagenome TaxID=1070528 RepID=A0A6C0KXW2_9ZZZZ|tara:strand:- start:9587 stop:10045 length:459 start_codon:yes stop_codon:yes gene_type:complete